MKDIKIHHNEKNNLISIKPIEDIYYDRCYFISIIENLSKQTNGCVYVEVSRPNYIIDGIFEKLNDFLINSSGISYTINSFEISFSCIEINKDFFDLLFLIWFGYEHSTIVLLSQNEINYNDVYRKDWFTITSKLNSFVIFKGAEEDVVWIGKSEDFEFDFDFD